MSSKDERIVEMVFDNAQFEKGVEQTRRSLKELDQSLEFKNATDGFSRITSAANGVDLSSIAKGVESLQDRFSLFGIMGMKIMEELATSAINVGKKIWSATFGQIKTGGINRAMNIENAHFMLQGLLKDEEKVQEIMGWAMDSVDGTAYAFDSAAKAASQFAASGVVAEEDMTKALKAITGVAAMTNSEYEDISRIFTTVAGNGRLMGDQLLQLSGRGMNAASTIMEFFNGVNDGSKTASEGVTEYVKSLTKGMSVTESDIREFVSKGKINFDVFSEAMNEAFGEHAKKANETLTGVLSNVKAALSKIGADFVSPLIVQNGPLVDFFNALRQAINRVRKELGPFQDTFVNAVTKMAQKGTNFLNKVRIEYIVQAMAHGLELIKQLIAPIGEAFRNVFGETTMFQVNKSIKSFKEFVLSLEVSERAINNIKSIFGGFFAALSIGKQIFSALLQLVSPLIEKIFGFGANVADATASVGDHIIALDKWLKESGYLSQKVEQIQQAIGRFVEKIKNIVNSKFVQDKIEFAKGLIKDFVNFLKSNFGSFEQVSGKLGDFFGNMKDKISNFLNSDIVYAAKNLLKLMIEKVGHLAESVWKAGKTIISTIRDIFAGINVSDVKTTAIGILTGALNLLGEAIEWVGGVAVDFSGSIGTLFDGLGTIGGGILNGIIGLVQSLTGAVNENGVFSLDNVLDTVAIAGIITIVNDLSGAISNFTNNISSQTLKDIAEALGILTLALIALANIEKDKLEGAVATISLLFGELVAAYQLMRKTSAAVNGKKIGNTLREFIGAFTNKEGLGKAFDSLAALAAGFKFKNLVDIAKAILILSASVVLLSLVPKDALYRSLSGISLMMLELTLMFKSMSKIDTSKAIKTGSVLISTSIAVLVLSAALKSISSLDMDAITRGITGLTYIMFELSLLAKSISKNGEFEWFSSGTGLILMATSIVIFAQALKSISSLSSEQISVGMIGLSTGLIAMALAVSIISKATNGKAVMKIGATLVIISAAMLIFAEAISKIAGYDLEHIGGAMAGLAGGLLLMIMALTTLNMLPGKQKMLSVGVALTVIAASFVIFSEAISKLAKYDLDHIGNAMAGLAGAMLMALLAITAVNFLPNEKQLIRTGLALSIIGASLVIFAEAINMVAGLSLDQVGSSLAGLAGAMLLAITALAAVDMLPGERQLLKTGVALSIIGASMIIFAEAINRVGQLNIDQVGSAMAGLAGAMLLAIAALAAVDMLPGERELIKTGAALIVIGGAMIIFGEAINHLAGLKLDDVGTAMAGLAGAMLLAIASIAAIDKLPGETEILKIATALATIGGCMIIFGEAIKNLSGLDLNTIGSSLAGIAGAMLLAITAIAAINMLPNESELMGVGVSLALIGGSMIVFGEAIKVLADIPLDNIGNSMAGLGGAMLLAVAAMAAISKIKSDKILKSSLAIVAMGGAMILFSKAISSLKDMTSTELLYGVLAIGIALGTVAITAALLAPLAPGIQKLGLAFLAFGAGVAVAGIGIAAAVASIAAFIVVLMKLADLGSGAIRNITTNINQLAIGIADALGSMVSRFNKYFDEHSDEAIRAIIGFFEVLTAAVIGIIPGVLVGIVEALANGMKQLKESNAVYEITDSLVQIITQAAKGINEHGEECIDALVDALVVILEGLGGHADEIVNSALSLLVNLMNSLAKGVIQYSDPLVQAIKNIFMAIGYFAISLLQGVLRLIPGLGEEVADKLEPFKQEIKNQFSEEEAFNLCREFGDGAEHAFEEAKRKLERVQLMPEVIPEDWAEAQKLSIARFGDESWAGYIYAIQQAAPGVRKEARSILYGPLEESEKQKQLYELLGGESIEYYSRGINAHAFAVEEAQKAVNETQEKWLREQSPDMYKTGADNTATVALGIQDAEAVQKVKDAYKEMIDNSQSAEELEIIKGLAYANGETAVVEYALAIAKSRGYVVDSWDHIHEAGYEVLGDTTQEEELATKQATAYGDTLKNKGVEEATEASTSIGDAALDRLDGYIGPYKDKALDMIGGATESVQFETPNFQGEIDNMMGGSLTTIEGYEGLFDSTTEETVGGMTTGATSAGDNYIRVMRQIGTKGPLELVKQKNDFSKAGSGNISEYSSGMNSSSAMRELTAAIADAITKAIQKILSYSKDFNSKGMLSSQEYAKGLAAKARDAEAAGESLSKSGANGASNNSGQFKSAGNTDGKVFANGIEGMASVVRGSGAVIAQSGTEGAGGRTETFKERGRQAGEGFAVGIESKTNRVYNTAWSLAGQALAALSGRLQVNSPSKASRKIGYSFGEGFEMGIEKYDEAIQRVSEDLAEEALDGLQNGIEQIAKIADMDMDYAPTIRPVVDLSSVMDGITSMNTMFDESHAVAAQASFDMYSAYSRPDYIQEFAKMAADNESKLTKIIDKQTDVLLDIRTRLAHQQVVLDSGELVGATINKIDEALGERMSRAERGN